MIEPLTVPMIEELNFELEDITQEQIAMIEHEVEEEATVEIPATPVVEQSAPMNEEDPLPTGGFCPRRRLRKKTQV